VERVLGGGTDMNDLIVSAELAHSFPDVVEGLKKASDLFERIKSFEDLERLFLEGSGLSSNTYRSYLEAVRQFYQFTKGLNPLQVRPADIEAFYDHLLTRVDRNTAYLRIRGLKKFFEGIRNVVPFYQSPFEIMGEKLHAKLNCTKKGNRTKKTLTREELKALLEFLRKDTSARGLEDYALAFMLVTSGLRASELCALRWGDLEQSEGKWTALFIGKGGKEAEQELFAPAVEACRLYFLQQFRRVPKPEDALFWTVPSFPH
jgi:integrase